jgi:hypothetical protein
MGGTSIVGELANVAACLGPAAAGYTKHLGAEYLILNCVNRNRPY